MSPEPTVKPVDSDGIKAVKVGFVIVAALVLGSCGVLLISGNDGESSNSDASAQMACAHWQNIANDAAQGILGNDQILPKLREVQQTASGSDDIAISTAATALLRDVTQLVDITDSATALTEACLAVS